MILLLSFFLISETQKTCSVVVIFFATTKLRKLLKNAKQFKDKFSTKCKVFQNNFQITDYQ